MLRADLYPHLDRIDQLAAEMDVHVPSSRPEVIQFRAELAGLLVVAIAATYEACVKETLAAYAYRCGNSFGEYADRAYSKLNSKVSVNDLKRYAKNFNPDIELKFKDKLKKFKSKFDKALGKNIENSYEQLFKWRHDYAHASIHNTTIEEALKTHRYAKYVVYAFFDAFQ